MNKTAWWLLPGLLACGPPAVPTVSSAMEGSRDQASCSAEHGAEDVVLELPAADRATLEAESTRELVAVAYHGCELRVLTDCGLTGTYEMTETAPERDTIEVDDSTLLPNVLPLFVPGFGAHLSSGHMLRLQYVVRGERRADVSSVSRGQLAPECRGATHVVAAMAIGAFELTTGDRTAAGAQAPLGEGGVGASHRNSRQERHTVGDPRTCRSDDTSMCSAVVRAELVPLR